MTSCRRSRGHRRDDSRGDYPNDRRDRSRSRSRDRRRDRRERSSYPMAGDRAAGRDSFDK